MKNKWQGICEIISIGDELLIGQVINTNASWMGEQLSLNGLELRRVISIGDRADEISSALTDSISRADFVFITGGLGPTADDITKPVLCDFFKTDLIINQTALEYVTSYFQGRGLELTERNRSQALLPANCIPIQNFNGTAPGMWFQTEKAVVVSMPGVPFEMKAMFTNQVIPKVKILVKTNHIAHRTILTCGVGESFLADLIKDWELALPTHFKLAYLPQPGMVRLRLSGSHTDQNILDSEMSILLEKLQPLIAKYVFGTGESTMEQVVGSLLKEQQKTLATAESCTGGYLAHLITSVPGSSAYFKGSVIAYDNTIKSGLLGVSEADLILHGAVSQEVAEAMAIGARKKLKTDYALATTGIAGPDGGTDEKPVGTVWIALASENGVKSKIFRFGDHRGRNIHRSALESMNMLRMELIRK
ncbi:MAG: competence/damage-inducible protein A [Bacteroidales bacterium]